MRTMLLLGTAGIALALGCLDAQAIPLGSQGGALDEQALIANSAALAIAGPLALIFDGGDAAATRPGEVDRGRQGNQETGMRR